MYPRILVAINNVLVGLALGTDNAQLRKCVFNGVMFSNLNNAFIFFIFNIYTHVTRGIVTLRGIVALVRSLGFCCGVHALRKVKAAMVSKLTFDLTNGFSNFEK